MDPFSPRNRYPRGAQTKRIVSRTKEGVLENVTIASQRKGKESIASESMRVLRGTTYRSEWTNPLHGRYTFAPWRYIEIYRWWQRGSSLTVPGCVRHDEEASAFVSRVRWNEGRMIKRNPIKLNGEGFNRKTQRERERGEERERSRGYSG